MTTLPERDATAKTRQAIKRLDEKKHNKNASIFGDWSTTDSDGNALAVDPTDDSVIYKATSDGFVCVFDEDSDNGFRIYTDSNNPPTTERVGLMAQGSGQVSGMPCPVKENHYWKVRMSATPATRISWLPIGSGVCEKQ